MPAVDLNSSYMMPMDKLNGLLMEITVKGEVAADNAVVKPVIKLNIVLKMLEE